MKGGSSCHLPADEIGLTAVCLGSVGACTIGTNLGLLQHERRALPTCIVVEISLTHYYYKR